MTERTKSAEDWCDYFGAVVYDADGWRDQTDPCAWADLITKEEFARRWCGSTCRQPPSPELLEVIGSLETEKHSLYPDLPEGGGEALQDLVDRFREEMKNVAQNVLDDMYTDVSIHCESDHWTNFRNAMIAGLVYDRKSIGEHDWKSVRDRIFAENREAIIEEYRTVEIERLEDKASAFQDMNDCQKQYIVDFQASLKDMTEQHNNMLLRALAAERELEKLNSDMEHLG